LSIERVLRAYTNKTDRVAWEIAICGFSLPAFQAEFGVLNPEDPMFECFPVHPENVQFLEKYVANPRGWDFVAESYFVEAYTT